VRQERSSDGGDYAIRGHSVRSSLKTLKKLHRASHSEKRNGMLTSMTINACHTPALLKHFT
jgi:hypothetical protein